jgi:hypothetical protein
VRGLFFRGICGVPAAPQALDRLWYALAMKPTPFVLIAVPAIVCTMAGCEQKLTDDKFDQLKQGMTGQEVEGILGCGGGTDETSGGFDMAASGISGSGGTDRVYMYKSRDRSVTVTYRDGKAVQFVKRGF